MSGCNLLDLQRNVLQASLRGTVAGTTQIDPSSAGAPAPLVVTLHAPRNGPVLDWDVQPGPGEFRFEAPPGRYWISAFADRNRDLEHQPDEPSASQALDLRPGARASELRLGVKPQGPPVPGLRREPAPVAGPAHAQGQAGGQMPDAGGQAAGASGNHVRIGEITSLDHPRFGPSHGADGLWRPDRFRERIGGGVWFTAPYAAGRLPVLFIHGMGGSPADFRLLADHIAGPHIQPWFASYESFEPFEATARRMTAWLNRLQVEHGFSRIALVGHSAGGLLAMRLAGRLSQQHLAHPQAVQPVGVITFATPWDGHPAASAAFADAPFVAPAWRDLAPGSSTLASIRRDGIADGLRFAMAFAYRGGFRANEAGDGTAPLRSQLQPDMQRLAHRAVGLDETHGGILTSTEAARFLAETLGALAGAPPRSAGPHP